MNFILSLLKVLGVKMLKLHFPDDEQEKEGDRPELTVPFDEQEFLQGKIPVLGGEAKPREPIGKFLTCIFICCRFFLHRVKINVL